MEGGGGAGRSVEREGEEEDEVERAFGDSLPLGARRAREDVFVSAKKLLFRARPRRGWQPTLRIIYCGGGGRGKRERGRQSGKKRVVYFSLIFTFCFYEFGGTTSTFLLMRARTETGAEKEKQREREGQSRAAAEKPEEEGEQGKKRRERKKNDVSPFRFFFYVLFVRGSSSFFSV